MKIRISCSPTFNITQNQRLPASGSYWPNEFSTISRQQRWGPSLLKTPNTAFSCRVLPSHFVVSGEILSRKWYNCTAGRKFGHKIHSGCARTRHSSALSRSTGGRAARGPASEGGEERRERTLSNRNDSSNTAWRQTSKKHNLETGSSRRQRREVCWPTALINCPRLPAPVTVVGQGSRFLSFFFC